MEQNLDQPNQSFSTSMETAKDNESWTILCYWEELINDKSSDQFDYINLFIEYQYGFIGDIFLIS